MITTFYVNSDFRNNFLDLDLNHNPTTSNVDIKDIEADAPFSQSGLVFVRRQFGRDAQGERNKGHRIDFAGQIWTQFEKRRNVETRTDVRVKELICYKLHHCCWIDARVNLFIAKWFEKVRQKENRPSAVPSSPD